MRLFRSSHFSTGFSPNPFRNLFYIIRGRFERTGMAIIVVLMAITSSLIFATFLLQRSISHGQEKIITKERTQLELLCHSMIEAAKLKIKAQPTELYNAFRYKFDEPPGKQTSTLYDAFLSDLRIEVLDSRLKSENASMAARITSIERMGISQKSTGLSSGYVEDYYRITASASNQIQPGVGGGEADVVMQITIQMQKLEGS
ncbi:MAG: hypothetical protein HQM08_16110 [Candidatus Riflebacteria bacterium]|nr:hypothetical protein [Candidatus Riflebacteria bacterium]